MALHSAPHLVSTFSCLEYPKIGFQFGAMAEISIFFLSIQL